MPRVYVTPTTYRDTQGYSRPEGLPQPVFTRNPIGVVALAAINGKGAYARRARAAAKRSLPGRPGKKALAAEARYRTRRRKEGKAYVPLGKGRFDHMVQAIVKSGLHPAAAKAIAAKRMRDEYGSAYFQDVAATGQKRARARKARKSMRSNTHKETPMQANRGKGRRGRGSRKKSGGRGKSSAAARAMRMAARGGMSLKAAWRQIKGRGGKTASSRRKSAGKSRGKSRMRHFVARGKKSRSFRYGRTTGASKMTIRGRGSISLKGGKRTVKKRFRKGVQATVQSGRLRVFAANKGRKGKGKSRFHAMRSHYKKHPPSAEEMQAALDQMRGMAPEERLKKAYKYLGTAPTYRTVMKKERVLASTGGFKLRGGKRGRPTFGKGKGHIQEWQFVGAPSAAYYAAFPDDNGFAHMRDLMGQMRASRKEELSARSAYYAGRADKAASEGDMYAPNRHKRRRGRKGSKRSHRGGGRRAWKMRARTSRRGSRHSTRRRARRGHSASRWGARAGRRHAGRRHARRGYSKRSRWGARSGRRAGRRGSRRGYRRNGSMVANGYGDAMKQGLMGFGGFVAHKLVKNVLSTFVLSKVDAFNTGALATWKPAIASLVAALIGIPLASKLDKNECYPVTTGVVVSFAQDVLSALLTMAGQDNITKEYLGAIPSVSITDYYGRRPGSGFMSGYGDYFTTSSQLRGLGGAAAYSQAAAGYGAASMEQFSGAGPYAQAAAGYGMGEYEPMSGGVVMDGIHGDNVSAERALNAADGMAYPMQAAAGLGRGPVYPQQAMAGIPRVNTWIPDNPRAAIHGFGDDDGSADSGPGTDEDARGTGDPALDPAYSTGVFSGSGDGIFQASMF